MDAKIRERLDAVLHSPQVRKKRRARIAKQLLKTACLFGAAVALSAAAHFDPLGYAVASIAALLLSVVVFRLYELPSGGKVFLGAVLSVRHDYRFGYQRGTGGWGAFYTTMRERHTVIVALESLDGASEYREVVCEPRLAQVYAVGDILLIHPDLSYPADLSSAKDRVCVHCGAICSADIAACDICGTPLLTDGVMPPGAGADNE